MIASIKHKGLKNYWEKDDASGIEKKWLNRIDVILAILDDATDLDDVNVYGKNFHALKGRRAGQYALKVSGNWRIVFEWDGQDTIKIDLVDYH